MCGMVKTTVYLDDADAAALRRLASACGRSRADIIREALGRVTAAHRAPDFRSLGVARGSGEAVGRSARSLARQKPGRRRSR